MINIFPTQQEIGEAACRYRVMDTGYLRALEEIAKQMQVAEENWFREMLSIHTPPAIFEELKKLEEDKSKSPYDVCPTAMDYVNRRFLLKRLPVGKMELFKDGKLVGKFEHRFYHNCA